MLVNPDLNCWYWRLQQCGMEQVYNTGESPRDWKTKVIGSGCTGSKCRQLWSVSARLGALLRKKMIIFNTGEQQDMFK